TSISMGQTARFMEVTSFALVLIFGLVLLVRKLPALFRRQPKNWVETQPETQTLISATIQNTASSESSLSISTRMAAAPKAVRLNYQPATGNTDHIFIGN